jgi:hypothetical protein
MFYNLCLALTLAKLRSVIVHLAALKLKFSKYWAQYYNFHNVFTEKMEKN